MMWGLGYGGGWGGLGWLGPLLMLAFWALVIIGVVFLVRYLVRHGRALGHQDSALDILKGRYARGEIQKEEFEAKRRDLT